MLLFGHATEGKYLEASITVNWLKVAVPLRGALCQFFERGGRKERDFKRTLVQTPEKGGAEKNPRVFRDASTLFR